MKDSVAFSRLPVIGGIFSRFLSLRNSDYTIGRRFLADGLLLADCRLMRRIEMTDRIDQLLPVGIAWLNERLALRR